MPYTILLVYLFFLFSPPPQGLLYACLFSTFPPSSRVMSFNRVLPRPLGLDNDPSSSSPSPSHKTAGNLHNYKVMADHATPRLPLTDRTVPVNPPPTPSLSSPYPVNIASSINKAKVAGNKVSASAPIELPSPNKRHYDEDDTDRSSSSPEKAPQFCLCRPDPKIPRPRTG